MTKRLKEILYYVEGFKDSCSIVYSCKSVKEMEEMFCKLRDLGYHIVVFRKGKKRLKLEWFCCSTSGRLVPICERLTQ